jgi:uncharacterized protein YeeX (DUF496 family)
MEDIIMNIQVTEEKIREAKKLIILIDNLSTDNRNDTTDMLKAIKKYCENLIISDF